MNTLSIKNLFVSTDKKEIIKGMNLEIKSGEVHAIMGPNGAGKTTLAMSLMGNPNYKLTINNSSPQMRDPVAGQLTIDHENLIDLPPEQRARKGLFVSFQHPVEITGVSVLSFLRTADKALHPDKKIPLSQFKTEVKDALKNVSLTDDFMQRSLNEGFSGGEKKRAEIAQLLVLKPKFAILDEIDSGLDVDSLKIVAKTIDTAVKKYNMGVLLITHYQRILHHVKPDYVHVLVDGKIKKSGSMMLVEQIEKDGYASI